jgi:Spy/CpxP family protein refolding chaperone
VRRAAAAAFAAACALSLAVPAIAQVDMPDGKWWKRPRIARAIDLTDEQSRRIEDIFVKSRPRLIDLKADLEKKQFDLKQSLERDADRDEVERKLDTVEAARRDLQKTRVLMLLDMRKVLKPEQWERLKQMREANRERRRDARQDDRAPQRPGRRGR